MGASRPAAGSLRSATMMRFNRYDPQTPCADASRFAVPGQAAVASASTLRSLIPAPQWCACDP